MFTVRRIVALTLAVAVLAATAGAFLTRSQNVGQSLNADMIKQTESRALADDLVADLNENASTMDEELAYQKGYEEGLRASQSSYSSFNATPTKRVVYQSGGRSYSHARIQQKRSFWDKHRDKLTVGIGAGTGALVGGLAGGKKWALIGAGIGAGGAALYTYKIRKRDRR
jgi:hypothetical protein